MSRPSQLPPRCPLQRKAIGRRSSESSSFGSHRVNESGTRHQRALSQSSLFEEQPAWFDDLMSNSDSIPRGIVHCRSASDSDALFGGRLSNSELFSSSKDEMSSSEEGGNTLESACVYGPNSPRRKSNEDFSGGSMLLALSDYGNPNASQLVDDGCWSSGTTNFDVYGNCGGYSNDLNTEPKTGKRHLGQRSRARKLQYISELENTVNFYQALGSELAMRISALVQEKVVLSLENSNLKQQMARLQQKKLMMDIEYQTLKNEAEKLKLGLTISLTSKINKSAHPSDYDTTDFSWQKLDWSRLHL